MLGQRKTLAQLAIYRFLKSKLLRRRFRSAADEVIRRMRIVKHRLRGYAIRFKFLTNRPKKITSVENSDQKGQPTQLQSLNRTAVLKEKPVMTVTNRYDVMSLLNRTSDASIESGLAAYLNDSTNSLGLASRDVTVLKVIN